MHAEMYFPLAQMRQHLSVAVDVYPALQVNGHEPPNSSTPPVVDVPVYAEFTGPFVQAVHPPSAVPPSVHFWRYWPLEQPFEFDVHATHSFVTVLR